jgi:hypothetical protein
MNNFDEIKRALGPIPLGPVVGGKPLDGDGVISVVDPATEEVITEIANGTVAEAMTAVGWHTRRRTPGPRSAPGRAARTCAARSTS